VRADASVIVDDEFSEVGQRLPTVISAIPDDLFSSENNGPAPGRRRTRRLSSRVRVPVHEELSSEEEEDPLSQTMELQLSARQRTDPRSDARAGDSSDSSGPVIEFVLREFGNHKSHLSGGVDF
jgi:hypothetical protein